MAYTPANKDPKLPRTGKSSSSTLPDADPDEHKDPGAPGSEEDDRKLAVMRSYWDTLQIIEEDISGIQAVDEIRNRRVAVEPVMDLRCEEFKNEPHKLITVALYGGIDTLTLALLGYGVTPMLQLYADSCQDAAAVTRELMPPAAIFDYVEEITPIKVHEAIKELFTDADGGGGATGDTTVLITLGAPCKENTRIKGEKAKGLNSFEGSKFAYGCKWIKQLDEYMQSDPLTKQITVEAIIENVVPADPRLAEDLDVLARGTLTRTGLDGKPRKRQDMEGYFINPRDAAHKTRSIL